MPRKPRDTGAATSYAEEKIATAEAQAAFFQEQAQRHLSEAGQARTFAALAQDEGERAELRQRADYLETLSRHDHTIAEQITPRRGRA